MVRSLGPKQPKAPKAPWNGHRTLPLKFSHALTCGPGHVPNTRLPALPQVETQNCALVSNAKPGPKVGIECRSPDRMNKVLLSSQQSDVRTICLPLRKTMWSLCHRQSSSLAHVFLTDHPSLPHPAPGTCLGYIVPQCITQRNTACQTPPTA